jgi:hypothetical protein
MDENNNINLIVKEIHKYHREKWRYENELFMNFLNKGINREEYLQLLKVSDEQYEEFLHNLKH